MAFTPICMYDYTFKWGDDSYFLFLLSIYMQYHFNVLNDLKSTDAVLFYWNRTISKLLLMHGQD